MDAQITQLIAEDLRVSFALTDRKLMITQAGGAFQWLCRGETSCIGRPLVEVTPELIGSERILENILDGELPRFELEWVNCETSDGQTVYLMITELPYRDSAGRIVGLLHRVDDVTAAGRLQQEVVQRRNDLRLLQAQLARQNLELEAANAEL